MSKMDTWFRKNDPRRPKDPSKLFAFSDGYPMVVLRPAVTLAAMELVKDGTPHDIAAKFDDALNAKPHQFIGYLAKSGPGLRPRENAAIITVGDVVDKWGQKVGTIQPGDALCGGPQFELPMFMETGQGAANGAGGIILPGSGRNS